MAAPVRFVHSHDGTRIAYTVEGSGPALVWLMAPMLSHTELYPLLPGVAEYLAKIGRSRTLIRIDFRGTGMAAREFEDHRPEAVTDDLQAVVDHLGLTSIDIVAQGMRVVAAVRFANRRPDAVRKIVLSLPVVPAPVLGDHPGVPGALQLMRSNWEMWVEMNLQRTTGKPLDEVQDLYRYYMRCSDQRNLVAEVEASEPAEDWRLAGNVQCPVLVISRKNALAVQSDMLNLAHQLPQGRLIHLPEEASSPPFGSRPDLILQAIEEFLGPPAGEGYGGVAEVSHLTARERDVLALLARGHTEAEIAESLCITRPTVSRHVQNLYGKLGVHRRGEAVAWAVRNGLG